MYVVNQNTLSGLAKDYRRRLDAIGLTIGHQACTNLCLRVLGIDNPNRAAAVLRERPLLIPPAPTVEAVMDWKPEVIVVQMARLVLHLHGTNPAQGRWRAFHDAALLAVSYQEDESLHDAPVTTPGWVLSNVVAETDAYFGGTLHEDTLDQAGQMFRLSQNGVLHAMPTDMKWMEVMVGETCGQAWLGGPWGEHVMVEVAFCAKKPLQTLAEDAIRGLGGENSKAPTLLM